MNITIETQTFIGWNVYGVDAVDAREEDGSIACRESAPVIRFKLLMGILFGPVLSVAVGWGWWTSPRKPGMIAAVIMLFFSVFAWGAIYQALFRRRRVVFDLSDASVRLLKGRTLVRRLERGDIASLELSEAPRSVSSDGGTIRWTATLVSARLKTGEEVPLFESPNAETVRALHARVRSAFF